MGLVDIEIAARLIAGAPGIHAIVFITATYQRPAADPKIAKLIYQKKPRPLHKHK
jgi:hypothetical protein